MDDGNGQFDGMDDYDQQMIDEASINYPDDHNMNYNNIHHH